MGRLTWLDGRLLVATPALPPEQLVIVDDADDADDDEDRDDDEDKDDADDNDDEVDEDDIEDEAEEDEQDEDEVVSVIVVAVIVVAVGDDANDGFVWQLTGSNRSEPIELPSRTANINIIGGCWLL